MGSSSFPPSKLTCFDKGACFCFCPLATQIYDFFLNKNVFLLAGSPAARLFPLRSQQSPRKSVPKCLTGQILQTSFQIKQSHCYHLLIFHCTSPQPKPNGMNARRPQSIGHLPLVAVPTLLFDLYL